MSTKKKSLAGRILASVGAAALGVVGVAGLATTAMADTAWPDAETGSIQIHKKGMDKEDLEGVEFQATLLGTTEDGECLPFDLASQEGWVVADEAIKKYNGFFNAADYSPGHPNGPTADEALDAADLCRAGDPIGLGPTDADGLTEAVTVGKGLYLIEETGVGGNIITAAAAPFVVAVPYPTFDQEGTVTWTYNVVANAKNEITELEKPTKKVDGQNVDNAWVAGAKVKWTIEAIVPKASADYESIAIRDITESDLEFVSFDSINIVTVDEEGVEKLTPLTYTVEGQVATLDKESLATVNVAAKDGDVVLSAVVTTKVSEDYAGGELNNQAALDVNGTPGEPGGEDVTVWGAIKILKVDQKQNPLTGGKFQIYPAIDGSCEAEAPEGAVEVEALDVTTVWIGNGHPDTVAQTKDYCVLETVAPAGYVLDSEPKMVTVTNGKTVEVTQYEFVNTPAEGPELPVTGANGTVLMTVGGIALVAIAGGLYLSTRRKATQE